MLSAVRSGMFVLAFCLGGCAFTPEKIDVAYAPSVGTARIPGAENVRVEVTVNDVRTVKDRVASKSNAYGAQLAPISINQDLVTLVKDALKTELSMRGYVVDGGNIQVVCDIFDFANNFRPGFWSGTAEAGVRLQVKVRDKAGNITFAETVSGQGAEEHIQMATGRNAKPALEKALQATIASLMARQDFHQALLRAGSSAQIGQ